MTEKELHRLRRHDLLQLLLAQGREAAQLQARIGELETELNQLQEINNRFIGRMDDKDVQLGKLKERLDEKDAQIDIFKGRLKEKDERIDRLKGRLDQKDTRIGELRKVIEEYRSGRIFEMSGRVSIAEVGQKLEGIFIAAQKAVDQYLENLGETVKEGGLAGNEEQQAGDAPPDAASAEIEDAGEQNEKETDRDPNLGAAGGGTEEGTIQTQLRTSAEEHGILSSGGSGGSCTDSSPAVTGSAD